MRYRHLGLFECMAGTRVVLLACLRCGAVVEKSDVHAHDLTHEPLDSTGATPVDTRQPHDI